MGAWHQGIEYLGIAGRLDAHDSVPTDIRRRQAGQVRVRHRRSHPRHPLPREPVLVQRAPAIRHADPFGQHPRCDPRCTHSLAYIVPGVRGNNVSVRISLTSLEDFEGATTALAALAMNADGGQESQHVALTANSHVHKLTATRLRSGTRSRCTMPSLSSRAWTSMAS